MEGDKAQPHHNTPAAASAASSKPEGGVAFDAPAKAPDDVRVPPMSHEEVDRELEKAGVTPDDNAPSWLAEKKAKLASKPAPKVEPKPQPAPKAPPKPPATLSDIKKRTGSELLRPLRTYKDDIARAIQHSKISKIDISVAQQQRKLTRMEEERSQLELKEKIEKDRARLQALQATKRNRPQVPETAPAPPKEHITAAPKAKVAPVPPTPTAEPQSQEPQLTILKKDTYEMGELARQAAATRKEQPREPVKVPPTVRVPAPPPPDPHADLKERIRKSQETFERKADLLRETTPVRVHERTPLSRGMKLVLASFCLLVLGAGALAGTFYLNRNEPAPFDPLQTETLVFAEQTQNIAIESVRGNTLLGLLSTRAGQAQLPLNAIENFKLTAPSTTGEAEEVTSQEWFQRAETAAPSALIRALHPKFMLGVHSLEGNQPFLVFKTSFYENAFAGMLAWETTMSRDLAPLFGPAVIAQDMSTDNPTGSNFKDRLINNLDTRVLLDLNGEVRIVYGFIDRQTLLITTNRETFLEVTDRLQASRIRR